MINCAKCGKEFDKNEGKNEWEIAFEEILLDKKEEKCPQCEKIEDLERHLKSYRMFIESLDKMNDEERNKVFAERRMEE